MKKFIICLICLTFILCSRDDGLKIKNIEKNKFLTFEKRYIINIKKTNSIGGELHFINSLKFYGITKYSRRIIEVKLLPNLESTSKFIGRQGQGPGEYVIPLHIFIRNNYLYYIDNFKLKSINLLNGKYGNNKIKNIQKNPFIITNNLLFTNKTVFYKKTKNNKTSYVNAISLKTGNLEKSLIKLDEIYYYLYHTTPGDICYDKENGRIYTSYSAPFIINRIDTNLNVLESWNLEEKVGNEFKKMTSQHFNNLKKCTNPTDGFNIYGTFHKLIYLDILKYNEKNYYIAMFNKKLKTTNKLFLCYLIDDSGNILDTFNVENVDGMGVYKNKLYLMKEAVMGKEFTYLEMYKLKVKNDK